MLYANVTGLGCAIIPRSYLDKGAFYLDSNTAIIVFKSLNIIVLGLFFAVLNMLLFSGVLNFEGSE